MSKLQCSMSSELRADLADPRIPTLQGVLDPCELGRELHGILPAQWGELRDIQIHVLRHHPGNRCAVDINLEMTTGTHRLIGKVYANDRMDVYRAMRQFGQCGFGIEDEFSIPQPIAFLPKLQLLLQERVDGPTVKAILMVGDGRQRARVVERSARWLAHFHTKAQRLGPVFDPTHELMKRWQLRIVERERSLTDKVELLLKRLKLATPAIDAREKCSSHGEYDHRHIVLMKTRTVVFDWDSYCVADPAYDVAKFTLKLQQLAFVLYGSLSALDDVAELFCQTYKALSGFKMQSLSFYMAFHCLKHAKNLLKEDGGGSQKANSMLDEGLRILTKET